MTSLYPHPNQTCAHPPLDEFEMRGVGRLCDGCLLRLHELGVGVPPGWWFTGVPNRFKTDWTRARCLAAVLGVVAPHPRDLELLPVAASVVARCDDLLAQHAVTFPPWTAASVRVARGSTGDVELDRALALGHVETDADCDALAAAIDQVTEVADA